MSKPADNVIEVSDTLTLCEYKTGGNKGFWLYDKTRGMNLALRENTETDAFVKALHYYQTRLEEIEEAHDDLAEKITVFISQFPDYDRYQTDDFDEFDI